MVCFGWLKNDLLWLRSPKCCVASRWNGLGLDIQRPDQINFVWSIVFPMKFICDPFYINIIHKSIFLTGTSPVHVIWKCS